MQPISVSSVVLPEPLGPFRTVTCPGSMVRLTSLTAVNWFDLPALNVLVTWSKFDHGYDLMAASGSTVAARQDGMMVATV